MSQNAFLVVLVKDFSTGPRLVEWSLNGCQFKKSLKTLSLGTSISRNQDSLAEILSKI